MIVARSIGIGISFYGHTVRIDPDAVVDDLDPEATEDDIEDAVNEAIHEALLSDFPSYRVSHEREDLIKTIRLELERQREGAEA